jgi:hypothetical protein
VNENRKDYVIGARWIVRGDSGEDAARTIHTMLADLLGEQEGRFGYVGVYVSADSPQAARDAAKAQAWTWDND